MADPISSSFSSSTLPPGIANNSGSADMAYCLCGGDGHAAAATAAAADEGEKSEVSYQRRHHRLDQRKGTADFSTTASGHPKVGLNPSLTFFLNV